MPSAGNAYEAAVLAATEYRIRRDLEPFFRNFDFEKKSIILLPGGAGSELLRATTRFHEETDVRRYRYKVVWLDVGVLRPLVRDAEKLEINIDRRDLNEQIIVAGAGVRFVIPGIVPYVKAMQFFEDRVNVLCLGWDWRRNITSTVNILNNVLTHIRARLDPNGRKNVLQNTYLVGHSMGGMVAKLLFTECPIAKKLAGMISIGTPFYGYLGHLPRFFVGERGILNQIYTARTIARIYGTFPGLYTLLPIDSETFIRDKDELGKKDGKLSYPVTDASSKEPVDAYLERARYPSWVWRDELPKALAVRQRLAEPLPSDLANKVSHIRCVVPEATPVAATWEASLPPDYDPDTSVSPVQIVHAKEAGDGVVPKWSQRLASTPHAQIFNFDGGAHAAQMEQSFILDKVMELVDPDRRLSKEDFFDRFGPDPHIACSDQLTTFLETLGAKLSKIDWSAPNVERQVERLIPEPLQWRMLQEITMGSGIVENPIDATQ